jgi:CubicO group peptidase (beta-lactamase class C family)
MGFGMVFRFGLMAGIAALTLSTSAAAQADRHARVDEVFAEWDRPDSPGCAVSVMQSGAISYRRGYGMANLEYGIPITPSSIFHVASVSKQFTGMALVLLAAEGRLSLDDDVRAYVPEVPDFGHRITIRQLLHHTSGLRDQWSLLGMAGWRFEADVITQGDVLDITSRQTALNFDPGDQYLYSNTGFTVAAAIVERVTGQSFREVTAERIFQPLGMDGTHFHDDHNMIVPNRAYAYARRDDGGWRISIPDFDVVGATSLFTTVEDLGAWEHNFFTARVGGVDGLQALQTRGVLNDGEVIDYALGIGHGSYRGLPTVGHGGADAGYRSQFLRFPEQKLGVSVLCNFPTSNPGRLAQRVAEVYLEGLMVAEESDRGGAGVHMSPDALQRLAGVYHSRMTNAVRRVTYRDNALWADVGGETALTPLGDGRFRLGDDPTVVTLAPDGRDEVPVLRIPGDPSRYVWRPTVDLDANQLTEYQGVYVSHDLGTEYELVVVEGALVRRHRKLSDATLTPTYRDGFSGNGFYDFTRDRAGRIHGFTISSERVWKVEFSRIGSP